MQFFCGRSTISTGCEFFERLVIQTSGDHARQGLCLGCHPPRRSEATCGAQTKYGRIQCFAHFLSIGGSARISLTLPAAGHPPKLEPSQCCRNPMSIERICGEKHYETDLCRCGDNCSVCTVGRARSRARRRRSAGCVVGSGCLGTRRRRSRCCGWLHGGSLYCSLMGTEEIRPPSRGTICKTVQKRSFQSRSVHTGSCHGKSCQGDFGATRPTFDAISPRRERDAACPDIGMSSALRDFSSA